MPELEILLTLMAVACLAGFIDAIAGGGGLLCIPALLWAGVPPLQTLGTNKLQAVFGTFSATLNFIMQGQIRLREMLGSLLLSFCGAATGSFSVQLIDPGILEQLLPLLLVCFALYFLFSPRVGDLDARQRIGMPLFAASAGFGIGFYDGFFGPGTGSFFALACVALLGYNLRKATAQAKLLNFTSNLASLLVFLLAGQLVWGIGLGMAIGQLIGGWLGAHMVLRHGTGLIRPLLVLVSVAMAMRLLLAS
jgi:uncharacterized membrane protein YfcA